MNWRLPEKGFEPEQATAEQLDARGFPRQPNPETQPALAAAWRRMFESPLNWVDPAFDVRSFDFIQPLPVNQMLASRSTRFEKSRNWCGATIVPNGGNQFVDIFGEWTVPTPSAPSLGPPNKPTYFGSVWIGLDGDRQYFNSSLPQVGTQQNVVRGPDGLYRPQYYAWFQWWLGGRDRTITRVKKITGLHIDGGLNVMGLVWAIDSTHVLVLLRNFAPYNQITAFIEEAPKDNTFNIRPKISGATAEWIVERPTIESSLDAEPFAEYSPVTFSHCVAGMAGATGPSTSEKVLIAPRFKRMYEAVGPSPRKTHFISLPVRNSTDTTTFSIHYGT